MCHDVRCLMKKDGWITSFDQEIAEDLNGFFSSVFTTEPEADLPSLPDKPKGNFLNNITITGNDILNKLNRINLVAQVIVTHMY